MAHHIEASDQFPLTVRMAGIVASPLSACCLPLHLCMVHVTNPKCLVAVHYYHLVITTNMTEGRLTFRVSCGVRRVSGRGVS
jgi:hypothetical protein